MPPNPAVLYGGRAGIPHPMLPLPRVTMVFAALDGGRGRGARRHEAARIVHATLIRLMQVRALGMLLGVINTPYAAIRLCCC
jgi:hypothetical protein